MEHRINNIHKRALTLVYKDSHELMFQELLAKDKSVSVHQKTFSHWQLRYLNLKQRKRDHAVYHGSESLPSLAPKLWDLLPNSIKNSTSLK